METFKINTRFNVSKNQNEANCKGFFNSDFFTLIEIIKRQDEVYSMYLKNDENKNQYAAMYEALEHMRVSLVTK